MKYRTGLVVSAAAMVAATLSGIAAGDADAAGPNDREVMFLDRSDGEARIYDAGPTGTLSNKISTDWGGGWEIAESIRIETDQAAEVVLYDAQASGGTVRIIRPNDGNTQLVAELTTAGSQWDIVRAWDSDGDGVDDVLLYDADTGDMAVMRVAGQTLTEMYSHSSWRAGWDEIVPFNMNEDGEDDLIFYDADGGNPGKGVGAIYTNSYSGAYHGISRARSSKNWWNAWDKIIPGEWDTSNPGNELLFYSSSTGAGVIYTVGNNGSLSTLYRSGSWYSGWDQIVSLDINFDDHSDLVFFEENGPTPGFARGVFYTGGNGTLTRGAASTGWNPDRTTVLASAEPASMDTGRPTPPPGGLDWSAACAVGADLLALTDQLQLGGMVSEIQLLTLVTRLLAATPAGVLPADQALVNGTIASFVAGSPNSTTQPQFRAAAVRLLTEYAAACGVPLSDAVDTDLLDLGDNYLFA